MSNAANHSDDKMKSLSIVDDNAQQDVPSDSSSLSSNDVHTEDIKESEGKEASKSKPTHLVVVTEDALNSERMGPRLRAAREAKDWSLDAASKETRIHKDYLSAIEDMMPNLLPGMPKYQSYLRGYLNNYARALGLPNPDNVVQRYLNECGLLAMELTEEEKAEKAEKIERTIKRSWIVPVIGSTVATLMVCLAAGAYIFEPWKNDDVSGQGQAVGTPNTVISADALPAPAATAKSLSLHAVNRAWIEVRGADGTVYLSKEMAPGEVYIPRVGAGWTITARDGGAFEWHSNGVSLGKLAQAGLPVYSHAIDEALTREPIDTDGPLN